MQMRAQFSKIQITTYKNRNCKNKGNHKLNFYHCENFKCHVVSLFWSFENLTEADSLNLCMADI